MNKYFSIASRSATMRIMLIGSTFFALIVFPALPIPGEVLDAKWSYAADFWDLMDGYGEKGRQAYKWSSLTVDTLFPLLYTTLFAGALYAYAPCPKFRHLAYIAVLACILDICENVQIFSILIDYPEISMTRVNVVEFFTRCKWVTAVASGVIAAVFASLSWFRDRQRRR